MSYTDHLGHAVTAGDTATVDRYHEALSSLLAFRDDVVEAWDATVADEPDFALGQIGRAYLCCISSEPQDAAEARKILAELGDGAQLHDRERRHLAAARAYARGDLAGASDQLSELSVSYPRDALALAIGHQLDFFRGDHRSLRDRIGRVLLAWHGDEPHNGFVLGMHAFGLEESGLYPQAEAVGMRALDAEPRDVWALHAVVHVHEMQGRVRDGMAFMDERRADWDNGNAFVVHNTWHRALFDLEVGDVAAALSAYDRSIHNEQSANVALEMLDASALLWRIHLDGGVDLGDRWSTLAEAWAGALGEPWYVFNDAHAVMSFVGADRLDDARHVVARLRSYVRDTPAEVANVTMTAAVGLPVCEALVAFGEGRFGDVVELLHPIRHTFHRFGGSHAQRDALARTLLEAALRDGRRPLAEALISERLALKETSAYSWHQLSRLRRSVGDLEGASQAAAREAEARAS